MALFGKRVSEPQENADSGKRLVVGRKAYCKVCRDYRQFSRCWLRMRHITTCELCKTLFEDAAALYRRHLPACPRCGEFLEQPTFEYGLCDGCGSKYEITDGAAPCLLPNKKQRDEMARFGKSWSPD